MDRTSELQEWVKYCHLVQKRGTTIYAYLKPYYNDVNKSYFRQIADGEV